MLRRTFTLRYCFSKRHLAVCFGLLTAATALNRTCDAQTQFDDIEAAWRSRRTAVQSVDVQWSEQRVSQRPSSPGGSDWREIAQQLPNMRMCISGDKVRYEDVFVGETPDLAGPRIEGYNGIEYRRLSFTDGQLQKEPQGLVAREITGGFTGTTSAWPILLIFRGATSELKESTLLQFRNGNIDFDSLQNPVLRLNKKLPDAMEEVWTLKMRPVDFAPLQFSRIVGGITAFDIQIEYNADSMGFPTPSGWTVLMQRSNGGLLMSSKASVTLCKTNQEIDNSLFDLPFPVGTVVEDYRNARDITDMPRWTLIMENGDREIMPHELRQGVTREMLARTRPGEVFSLTPSPRVSVLLVANIVVVLALLVIILARWMRARQG